MSTYNESINKLLGIGGTTLVCRVIDLFFEHLPPKMAALQTQVTAASFQELERTAHSIKSSAANLGLEALRSAAQELESHARQPEPQLSACQTHVETMLAAYAEAEPFLREVRVGLNCP
ncbi:MAG: Hpt domain-containing protein [Candidatus Sericytochromatia bacterium]|nr:Hpt domain-containing protein [Candidatus Sericytochromatia bacterium]